MGDQDAAVTVVGSNDGTISVWSIGAGETSTKPNKRGLSSSSSSTASSNDAMDSNNNKKTTPKKNSKTNTTNSKSPKKGLRRTNSASVLRNKSSVVFESLKRSLRLTTGASKGTIDSDNGPIQWLQGHTSSITAVDGTYSKHLKIIEILVN